MISSKRRPAVLRRLVDGDGYENEDDDDEGDDDNNDNCDNEIASVCPTWQTLLPQ